jgi:anti-sigma factor RsiW
MMSENVMEKPEFEEAERLLPWYATGMLSEQEMKVVDDYLADHPEAAERLEAVREEQHLTIKGNEAIKAPGVAALQRLMDDIEAEGDARVQSAGLFEKIGAFLTSLSPQAMGIATAACLGLLIVQAGVIGTLVGTGGQTDSGQIRPAAGGNQVPVGPVALVAFQESATVMDISGLLGETSAQIVRGPINGGTYEIAFPKDTDLNAMIANLLERKEVVKLALPSGT